MRFVKFYSLNLLPLLISILSRNGYFGVNKSNVGSFIRNIPSDVASFIETHFDKVVNEYNLVSDAKWNANSIENRFEIRIDDTDEQYYGEFLDFDGENGYAVVGNDYTFLDFSTIGNSPFMDIQSDEYVYSTISGYLYRSGEDYLNTNPLKNAEGSLDNLILESKRYQGQTADNPGVGHIDKPDAYVKDRYGNGWHLKVH